MIKYISIALAGLAIALLLTVYVFPVFNDDKANGKIPGENGKSLDIPALIKGLRSPDQKARTIFHINLVDETGMYFGFKPSAFPEDREKIIARWEEWWAANSDKTREKWLAESLSLPGYRGKILALKKLRETGSNKCIPAVVELLSESDEDLRAEAVKTLGELEAKQADKEIIELLKTDDSMKVKRAAVRALGLIHTEKALVALENSASLQDDLAGIEAACALAIHSPDKAITVIESLLKSDKKETWEFAVNMLVDMESEKSILLLARLLGEEEAIGIRAYEALKEITGEDFGMKSEAWIEWHEKKKDNQSAVD